MNYSAEGYFLQKLFPRLNALGIRYAVMRNHHPLPYSVGGSDLDILVYPDDEHKAKVATLEAIQQAGGVPIGCSERVGLFQIHALGRTSTLNSPEWWGLHVDFFKGISFKGLSLLDRNVSWPVEYYRGIPVLTDGFAGVLGVLKEAFHNEVVPLRYAAAARSAAAEDWPQIAALLAPMGPPALARLKGILLSDLPPNQLVEACQQLKRDFFCHVSARQGTLNFLWQRAAYELGKLNSYFYPTGVVVAILGVDGAGKSTVINAILPALNAATHNAVTVQHLRPTVLPPLARLKGKKNLPTGPVVEPHGAVPSGTLGSLLRLVYLTLDYVLGYWMWTRPKIAKMPTVVIFDRYAYDMALDPRRFRISLSSRITGWFAALAPKPDLIVCLHGDPETIAARKYELSAGETRRQVEALRAFASGEPRAVLVSTDSSIEETRDAVLNALCGYLRTKAQTSG